MQDNLLKILGLDSTATDDEVDQKYRELRDRYRNDMFLEGAKGNEAARKLTTLENAYSDILSARSYRTTSTDDTKSEKSGVSYEKVEAYVKEGKINEAQILLDDISTRDGAWHYYQAMVYYKKDWFTDSKKQPEIALEKDPNNEKYKTALAKLNKVMSGGEKPQQEKGREKNKDGEWWKQNETPNSSQPNWDDNNRQMGGCDETMNCCTQLLCMNLLCNCCGGGC